MTIIVTVLKSEGDYRSEHVQRLHAQFYELPSVCLTDIPIVGVNTLQLRFNWPGWFSKMELFNPEMLSDDILYFDLDTLLLTTPKSFLQDDRLRLLSDFYHPDKPASGMMYIPHKEKAYIWNIWMADPLKWMSECRGDQDVLERICGRDIARFGFNVKSYKVHVAGPGMPGWHSKHSQGCGTIPPDTDVLCFHGYPRPWEIPMHLTIADTGF